MLGQDKPGVSPTTKLNKMNALERLSKSKSQKKDRRKFCYWIRCQRDNSKRLRANCEDLEGAKLL